MKATAKQFINLLQKNKGLQIYVAKALNCTRQAVSKRIRENPEIKAAYEAILEEQIDYAENLLMQNMGKGDTTALIFYLKCKAKNRGYVERQEVTGKDGAPVVPPASNPFGNLTKDEAKSLLKKINEKY